MCIEYTSLLLVPRSFPRTSSIHFNFHMVVNLSLGDWVDTQIQGLSSNPKPLGVFCSAHIPRRQLHRRASKHGYFLKNPLPSYVHAPIPTSPNNQVVHIKSLTNRKFLPSSSSCTSCGKVSVPTIPYQDAFSLVCILEP